MPSAVSNPLPAPGFPWRRILIAVWASAAAHVLLLSFVRVAPAPAYPQAETLQVRLDMPAPAEKSIALPQVNTDPVEPGPLPQTEASPKAPARIVPAKAVEPVAPHIDLPQLADPTYYDVRELDSPQLQPIESVGPMDPESGSSNPHAGYVRLQLKLEADGRVSDAVVLETNLPPEYERAALDAFGKARFHPARRNGQPVRARFKVELTFKSPPSTNSM